MFYAVYRLNGQQHARLYFSWRLYHADTFSPEAECLLLIPFRIAGKTYAEKKESVYDQALAFQSIFADFGCDVSYDELLMMQNWFDKMGRRFGLIREFRENCIA